MEQDHGQAGAEAQIHENQSPPVHHVHRIHQTDQREHNALERNQRSRCVNHKHDITQLCFIAYKHPGRHGAAQQEQNRGSQRDAKGVQQGMDIIQLDKGLRIILQRKRIRGGKGQYIQIDIFQGFKGIAQKNQHRGQEKHGENDTDKG